MATCLFTGDSLGPQTREEHTIQRSLGGRIRSRLVSSNAFNEKCGGLVDPLLADVYLKTMSVLGPALPKASRCGNIRVDVEGQPGNYVLDEFGDLALRGIAVLSHDPVTGRPSVLLASDEEAMLRASAQNAVPGGQFRRGTTLPPSLHVRSKETPALSPEIELAALKAALLSFDHLLADEPYRFTRSRPLRETLEFVRRCVMEGASAEPIRLRDLAPNGFSGSDH